METVEKIVAVLQGIGTAHGGHTPSQVALAWIIAKGVIPIPGAKNGAQAEDNAGALGWQMTDEEVAALDAVARERIVPTAKRALAYADVPVEIALDAG